MDETATSVGSKGYDCIRIFICKLTKMAHFVRAKKEGLNAAKLANLFFEHVYKLHGLPLKIISDTDPRINCELWQQLLKRAGNKLSKNSLKCQKDQNFPAKWTISKFPIDLSVVNRAQLGGEPEK